MKTAISKKDMIHVKKAVELIRQASEEIYLMSDSSYDALGNSIKFGSLWTISASYNFLRAVARAFEKVVSERE